MISNTHTLGLKKFVVKHTHYWYEQSDVMCPDRFFSTGHNVWAYPSDSPHLLYLWELTLGAFYETMFVVIL